MLEQFFTLPAIVRGHRHGLLGPYLDSFTAELASLGYPRQTVRLQCCGIRDLGRWLERNGLGVRDVSNEIVTEYLEDRRRRDRFRGVGGRVVRLFVNHLQQQGVVAIPKWVGEASALEQLVGRYTAHLAVQRSVVSATVDIYVPFVRRFLTERFGEGLLCLPELAASDVSGFVLRWAHSQSPGRAKLMVTALRSFLRFLLAAGEIEVDLAAAVPSVANWRQSTVPKYLSTEQVERVLQACDLRTAPGRRNYAVLLLLARLGLRAGEVVALELDHLDWRSGEIKIHGKGSFHDRMPLLPEVGRALANYLRRDRPRCATRRLFVRARAPYCGFASSAAITTIVGRALCRAGLAPPLRGAHVLRHSLATGMLRAGASMAEIGQVLRHRSSSTTEIYAKVDFDALRDLARPWPTTERRR